MIRIKAFIFIGLIGFQQYIIAAEKRLTLLTENPQQGSMIIAQLNGEGEVYFNHQKLEKTQNGMVVFGVDRESKNTISLIIKSLNKYQKIKQETYKFPIIQRQWKLEKIDGLPASKISPKSKQVLARISREAKLVRAARNKQSNFQFFNMSFIKPAEGRISGVYGSQRVLNGEPKRPHYGLDIANKTGTSVIAPATGVVSLVHDNMFYSGGTLIIDHGFGISTTYIHLSEITVKLGQKIKQGELIAKIGSTGRATGPHLDWRLNWFNTRLDPELLLDNRENLK